MTAAVPSAPPPSRSGAPRSPARRHSRRRARLRHVVCHLLGGDAHEDWLVKTVNWFLIALIVLNAASAVIESVDALAVAHGERIHRFDLFSVGVFTIEYVLRLWSAVDLPDPRFRHPVWGRLRWVFTPMALFDLLAILPFYLGIVVEIDLRAIRVLRVLRVFKLSRYSVAMNVMLAVVRQEARAIAATLLVLGVVVVVSASLMYLFEHRAQPEVFTDIPTAMWWAVVTLTTLGYGDMVPVTTMGRILGGLTAVLGVGMVALPAGVLASGFSEQMRLRREEYRDAVEKALEEGGARRDPDSGIRRRDRRQLEEVRIRLGLSEDEAVQVLEEAVRGDHICPHCGQPHANPPPRRPDP